MAAYALLATVSNQPGILFGVTRVLADHSANISYIDIIEHADRDAEYRPYREGGCHIHRWVFGGAGVFALACGIEHWAAS